MTRERVALFGGSFNPPHVGHLLAIVYALGTAHLDRVVVVPVFEHALGKQLVPFQHRLEMARRAFDWLPQVEVSGIEARLGAPSRTLSTILALEAEHPDWSLRLMVGSDILQELHQWHAYDEIARRAPPLVLTRCEVGEARQPGALLPAVSSSEIRELLARRREGQDVAAELETLVPRRVLEYLEQLNLY